MRTTKRYIREGSTPQAILTYAATCMTVRFKTLYWNTLGVDKEFNADVARDMQDCGSRLSRMVRKGLLTRIEKGVYSITPLGMHVLEDYQYKMHIQHLQELAKEKVQSEV